MPTSGPLGPDEVGRAVPAHGPSVLAHVTARLRAAGCVFAEEEAALLLAAGASPAGLEVLVTRRVEGEPLEQVLGWAEFCGLRLVVEPGVFVPRRRTEILVRAALDVLGAPRGPGRAAVVVDLCCGTGAVGAAVAAGHDGPLRLYATDIDPAAVRCARTNLPRAASVHTGDLDAPLPPALRGQVDVLVANAPYVPTDAIALMPPEARLHEARAALDGGADGVDVQRRVLAAAPGWLAPGGHVLVETSDRQASTSLAAARAAGLDARVVTDPATGGTALVATLATP